ncbi:hypothetical protein FBZ94_103757 [Bradyrhizobium sacchari]|uniref:Uncharacterized protein n=1 Tax=Bradyrhizobium sacchari TaxID=1399419 RepID=A0A560IW79_9BRAD|nr:hypothetical protein FBZ94_103757 [Bradyrhizobium sacchari]TWB76013.1 hypothetical protein FBZ95_104193 [Bradyrhizobium sacchari]
MHYRLIVEDGGAMMVDIIFKVSIVGLGVFSTVLFSLLVFGL